MASESGEESKEESMKELSASGQDALSRSRTPSNQDNIAAGKTTPSKASTIRDEHINADNLASAVASRDPSVTNRQGSNLTPARVSADVSGSIGQSDLEGR